MADRKKSWEQSLRDNVAQVAYDTYQSGKNFIDELKESPFKTIGGLVQKGGQVRQLDIIPEYVAPQQTYPFDPENSSDKFVDKLYEFDKHMKSYIEANPNTHSSDLFIGEMDFDGRGINIDKYYDELYKAVGGVEGVYRGRQKAGLNTSKYTDYEREQLRDYALDSSTLNSLSKPTVNELMDKDSFMYNNPAMVSGKSKGNYKDKQRNQYTSLSYMPFSANDEKDDLIPVAAYNPMFGNLGVSIDSVKRHDLPKRKVEEIFHHEMTHAKQDYNKKNSFSYNATRSAINNELQKNGKLPMTEIEAVVSEKMFGWQKKNNKVMMSQEDFDDFIKNTDFYYGKKVIPKDIIKIVAPRMVKNDTKEEKSYA